MADHTDLKEVRGRAEFCLLSTGSSPQVQPIVQEMANIPLPFSDKYRRLNVEELLRENCAWPDSKEGIASLLRALSVLEKYGFNLVNPDLPKYWRTVKYNNPIFRSTVGAIKGGRVALNLYGYTVQQSDGVSFPDDVTRPDIEKVAAVTVEIMALYVELESFAKDAHKHPEFLERIFTGKQRAASAEEESSLYSEDPPSREEQRLESEAVPPKKPPVPPKPAPSPGTPPALLTPAAHAGAVCSLCGSSPSVRCLSCKSQFFCEGCDEIFHRHPDRADHSREKIVKPDNCPICGTCAALAYCPKCGQGLCSGCDERYHSHPDRQDHRRIPTNGGAPLKPVGPAGILEAGAAFNGNIAPAVPEEPLQPVSISVSRLDSIIALYGQTIEVPCGNGAAIENAQLIKWKYNNDDGSPGDILTKSRDPEEVKILATNSYKDRVSIATNASLLIADATLEDQKLFTCIVVIPPITTEFLVRVKVHKRPLPPQIKDKVKELENGKLTTLGECMAQDANPPAEVIWSKNGLPLTNDGKNIIISVEKTKDPTTGLFSTSSKLQYTAVKADVDSEFACTVQHIVGANQASEPMTFSIHYPTERVTLEVISNGPIKEGDSVTLKCSTDRNPPPTSFNFFLKDHVAVVNSDRYTILRVTRDITGEYKCSLADDSNLQDAKNISVNFLDISLDPSGKIVSAVGESLSVTVQKNSSGDVKVSWTKDGDKLDTQPKFDSLKYSDAGVYMCEFSMAGIKQSRAFHLVVQGQPTIINIRKSLCEDGQHKVLTCEAEGYPEPSVQWSINGTNEQSSYENGKLTHRITVVPTGNLTVSCMVSNELGEDIKDIDVSSCKMEEGDDQAKLIMGIVIGLILAAAIVGLAYWVYMKISRQGSCQTGEEESRRSEEGQELKEISHKMEV